MNRFRLFVRLPGYDNACSVDFAMPDGASSTAAAAALRAAAAELEQPIDQAAPKTSLTFDQIYAALEGATVAAVAVREHVSPAARRSAQEALEQLVFAVGYLQGLLGVDMRPGEHSGLRERRRA